MKHTYETLNGKTISLAGLRPEEKSFLGEIFKRYESGINFLNFKHLYTDSSSMTFKNAKRLGCKVNQSPLYQVCDDLAERLGHRQGYLVKEEAMQYNAVPAETRKEMTTGEVARLAGCSLQAVRKAILTWRLRARKVGRLALIWDKDAEAFAQSIRRKHHGKHGGKKVSSRELAHA